MSSDKPVLFRAAEAADAERVAQLHVDSWRRHYRGAYTDAFLDGDVVPDRHALWSARLGAPSGSATVLAEQDGRLVGFVHVVFCADPHWGSLVDNLHVVHDRKRTGIGRRLLTEAADAVGRHTAAHRPTPATPTNSAASADLAASATRPSRVNQAPTATEAASAAPPPARGAMFLWVLEQNDAAQRFYRACGATCAEKGTAAPPGGDPSRLNGTPGKLRMVWPGRTALLGRPADR